jgi:hypothetical protein
MSVVCLLTSPPSLKEQAVIVAAANYLLAIGYQPSVGGEGAVPGFPEACVGTIDGRDLPETVFSRLRRADTQLYPLSKCPARLRQDPTALGMDMKPRFLTADRAQLRWRGLGHRGTLVLSRHSDGWVVDGAIGGIVGD